MLRIISIFSCGLFLSLSACSSSDTPASVGDTGSGGSDTGVPSDDTGTAMDTGGGTADTGGGTADTGSGTADTGTVMDAAGDTAPPAVNGCTDYIDATTDATKRKVTPWGLSLPKTCLKIKKGQSVTWEPAPSATHPLEASGGDTPSPIMNAATNTFPAEGTFGFHCANHPAVMLGAIRVVP